MASRAVMRETLAFLLRITSAFSLLLVLTAVVVTSSPLVESFWKNSRLGFRFWMAVGDLGRALATVSFVGCLALTIACRPLSGSKARRIGLYAWVNLATLLLSMFVPAVAAHW